MVWKDFLSGNSWSFYSPCNSRCIFGIFCFSKGNNWCVKLCRFPRKLGNSSRNSHRTRHNYCGENDRTYTNQNAARRKVGFASGRLLILTHESLHRGPLGQAEPNSTLSPGPVYTLNSVPTPYPECSPGLHSTTKFLIDAFYHFYSPCRIRSRVPWG